jgi:hypothetical protein
MNYLYGKNSAMSADWSKRLDKREKTLLKPLGWLPMVSHNYFSIEPKSVKRINRYLNFMNKRIRFYLDANDKEKALTIWIILMRISLSYQLVLFHKANSKWYWDKSEESVIREFSKLRNRLRGGSLKMNITRYYIEKKPSPGKPDFLKKFRPIGAPDWVSKAIAIGITDITAFMTENIQPEFQHAYRYNKGLHTAVEEIIKNIKDGYSHVLEFDLKGFFNNVRYKDITDYLNMVTPKLKDLVMNAIGGINYSTMWYKESDVFTAREANPKARYHEAVRDQWMNYNLKIRDGRKRWLEPQLLPEDELILDPTKEKTIARSGMPQGLNFSALVATVANPLNRFKLKQVLFSDDGVIFFKDKWAMEQTYVDLRTWYQKGVLVSWEKTRMVKDQFRFLGLLFDITNKVIFFDGGTKIGWKTPIISFYSPDLKNWLNKVITYYKREAKSWTWYIKRDSFIMRTTYRLKLIQRLRILYNGILWAKPSGNYRAIYVYGLYWKIVDITGSSTYCLDILLQAIKGRKYKKLKSLVLRNIKYDLSKDSMLKKSSSLPK